MLSRYFPERVNPRVRTNRDPASRVRGSKVRLPEVTRRGNAENALGCVRSSSGEVPRSDDDRDNFFSFGLLDQDDDDEFEQRLGAVEEEGQEQEETMGEDAATVPGEYREEREQSQASTPTQDHAGALLATPPAAAATRKTPNSIHQPTAPSFTRGSHKKSGKPHTRKERERKGKERRIDLACAAGYLAHVIDDAAAGGAEVPLEDALFDSRIGSRVCKRPDCSTLDFVVAMAEATELEPCVLIATVVLIARLVSAEGVSLSVTHANRRRLILTAAMIAEKVAVDTPWTNDHWSRVSGTIPLKVLNALEMEFVCALGFDLHVSPEEYAVNESIARDIAGPSTPPAARETRRK